LAINRDKVYEGAMKLLATGKFDKGIVELQKLTAEDPKDVRTLLKIAETLHVKMGKRKEALEAYDRAASIYSDQGFFLKAVAVFKQMLSVDATTPELHMRLAELYQQMGYGSQCLHHYQQVVVLYEQQGRSRETLGVLKRMVDLDPENLQSRVKVAELFFHQGMVQEAVSEMRQAFGFLKAQERYDDALRAGEKVFAWEPTAVDMARELGIIYMKRGEAKSALAKLQLCFQVAPRDLEVLGLIASAFLALDQTLKTVSVYKEMARIHDGDGNHAEGRAMWERVLSLTPGDDDAEIDLGRRQATAVATAAASPQAAAAPAGPRMTPEDEQLQRLLTETDVYVKYGLRDKAIEHLNKIFELRPDHLPALEKLRQLQNKTGQKAAANDTLRRMVEKGGEIAHPKVAEWTAELARLATPPPPPPPPRAVAKAPQSMEGEVILVEEDPPPDLSTLVDARRAPNMLASVPSMVVTPSRQPSQRAPAPAPPPPPVDEPFDEPFDEPVPQRRSAQPAPVDEPFDEPLDEPLEPARRGGVPAALPADEDYDAPTMNLPLDAVAAPRRRPPSVPELMLVEPDDGSLQADADALVRSALAADNHPAPVGLAPPLGSEEGMPADEYVLTAEPEDEPLPVLAARAPAPFLDDDAGMLDALAAQAVQEALPTHRPIEAGPVLRLSDDELGELETFARAASQEGPPAAAPPGDDDDFGERTVAYGGTDWQKQIAALPKPTATRPVPDDSLLETGERRAAPPMVGDDTGYIRPPVMTEATGEAIVDDFTNPGSARPEEFNPDEFDLPDDVKAMLASPAPVGDAGDFDGDPEVTGAFSFGDIPSLASMDADAVEELASAPPFAAPLASADDIPDGMSQSRALFAPERGFEDDPANTFFPDELAEAEFFIQQELLDEAREILEPILEEIEDSERVKHMLARVAAKEAGEPEPPPPWQQRLIDDVASEAGPSPEMSDPGQISVAEVLSQFKKGIAETVPEDDAATHYDLGIAYREMGLLDDAVGEFETAAKAATRAADSWFLIGLVRIDQGRADDALAAFDRAVGSPTASQAQQAAAEYQRGIVFVDHMNKGPLALSALKRSKLLGGTSPDLDRRIQALIKAHGDIDAASVAHQGGGDGRHKNIDYV